MALGKNTGDAMPNDAYAKMKAAAKKPAALPKCPVCDWPMAELGKTGCVPGNCSYRPDPESPEGKRVARRRAELAGEKVPDAKPKPAKKAPNPPRPKPDADARAAALTAKVAELESILGARRRELEHLRAVVNAGVPKWAGKKDRKAGRYKPGTGVSLKWDGEAWSAVLVEPDGGRQLRAAGPAVHRVLCDLWGVYQDAAKGEGGT